ncbi:hypothetical protein GGI22_001275, partial [Coemansia erecta]
FKNNSGVLVYSRVAHYITDGYGFTRFMNRWAEVSRWMQQPQHSSAAPLPVRQYIYDRSFHSAYRTKETTALEPKVIESLTTRTMLSRWLAWDIRASVQKHAPEGIRYSMHNVFAAYLTIVVGQAKAKVSADWWNKPIPAAIRAIFGNSLGNPVDFVTGFDVNIRTRISHPEASRFMGNMAIGKSIVVPQELIQTEPTAKALSAIALSIPSMVRHVPYLSTGSVFIMPAHPTVGGYELEFNLSPAVEAKLVRNNNWMKLVDKYDTYL